MPYSLQEQCCAIILALLEQRAAAIGRQGLPNAFHASLHSLLYGFNNHEHMTEGWDLVKLKTQCKVHQGEKISTIREARREWRGIYLMLRPPST